MKFVVLASIVASAAAVAVVPHRDQTASKAQAIRDHVNSIGTTWTAGDMHTSHRKTLMNVKYTKHPEGVEYLAEAIAGASIPHSFDARERWSGCKSIGTIRDQSQCGACWAFAAAEALTDRVCISSNEKSNPELSPEDPLSCCGWMCGDGCKGGYPIRAWQWATRKGFCTGSGYYEATGCMPYSIEPCGIHIVNGVSHHHNCSHYNPSTPICSSTCTNKNYNVDYNSDKHYAKSAYAVRRSVMAIQTEIMNNGPVEAAYTVYEDFYQYRSGVYQHVTGEALGGHAVKILGWGSENGIPYWLVANSWNTNWGESGFFRILMGSNECGIEEGIVAGLAKV